MLFKAIQIIWKIRHLKFVLKRKIFLSKKNFSIKRIHGVYLLKDDVMFPYFLNHRSWDGELVDHFVKILKLNSCKLDKCIVFDIGSNQGLFSYQLIQGLGSTPVKIIAVEPHPLYFYIASLNLSRYNNVVFKNFALVPEHTIYSNFEPKSLKFTSSNATATFSTHNIRNMAGLSEPVREVQVWSKKTSDFFNDINKEYVDYEFYMKIDIDGNDFDIALRALDIFGPNLRSLSFELTSQELSIWSSKKIQEFLKLLENFSDVIHIGKSGILRKNDLINKISLKKLDTGDIYLCN